jgi:hypothetical protein
MARSQSYLTSPTNLKSTFNYFAFFNAATKIDFAFAVIVREKTDAERLPGPEWRDKLDGSDAGKLAIFLPLEQRCEHFVEDHDTRDQRFPWEMPRQARVISVDTANNVKGHWKSFFLSILRQTGMPAIAASPGYTQNDSTLLAVFDPDAWPDFSLFRYDPNRCE